MSRIVRNRFPTSPVRAGSPKSRAGVAMLVAVVCLVVIASLGLSLLRSVVAEHRQVRLRHDQLQALWLAESAVQRGVIRLAESPAYAGEDWQVEVHSSGGCVTAAATIRVHAVDGDDGAWRIVVEARWPATGTASVLETRELAVPLGRSGSVGRSFKPEPAMTPKQQGNSP